jgi:SAM-dependent methyltransferase
MQDSNDLMWDGKLNISSGSVDYSNEDSQNYGYDPTPYVVLEELVRLDLLKKEDIVVDYGCGKGRIGFFLNDQIGCRVIGIDHDERLLETAKRNLEQYESDDVVFIYSKAEEYNPDGANRFYFFNPFSTRIFSEVLKRIEESYEKSPRDILIFFYYSTIEYKLYLPTEPRLELIESVYFTAEKINGPQDAKLDIFRFHSLDDY